MAKPGEIEQAAAQVLLQELQAYAAALPAPGAPPDLDTLKAHADRIEQFARGLPHLAKVTAFFVTRAELCHAIWVHQVGHADEAEVQRRLGEHRECIHALERVLRKRSERPTSGKGAQSALEALQRSRPPHS